MKASRQHLMRLLFALLSVVSLTAAHAQQGQYALYNYRNDGDFNAFLNIDIDSIRYSYIGLDSIEYDNVVVQEVWTPDSVYRIPIESIDSIGFRAPKPEFKDGIFHITENHVPYTENVDELTVTFASSIPTSMLPAVGQVVISDVYDTPFDAGFAGRVKSIVQGSGTIRIVCEEVGLDDVYDQLICVGKTIAYEDDEDYSAKPKAPRRIKINEDGTVEIPLGKLSHTLKLGSAISLGLSAKPSINFDYTIVYNVKGAANQFKLAFRPKVEYAIDCKVKLKTKENLSEYMAFIPIETGVPGLRCKIRFGAFIETEGNVSVDWKETFVTENCSGFDSSLEDNHGFFFNTNSLWEEPDMTLSLGGSLFCGPCMQIFCYMLYEKGFPSVKLDLKPGIELSGTVEFNDDYFTNYGNSVYDLLQNSKLSFAGVLKADASANFIGKKYELLSYVLSPDLLKEELYLFPKFTEPALQDLKKTSFTPSALYSEVTRSTLIPVKLGMGVYDFYDNVISEKFENENYWFWSDLFNGGSYMKKYLSEDMKDYPAGTRYYVRPIMKNDVIGTIKASPVAEFTVPEPLSLETTTVTLAKDQAQQVAVNGGWGDYSVFVLDKTVCSAELKKDGDNSYIQIVGLSKGKSTTVTVRDMRSQETKVILVKVNEAELQAVIKVEPTEIHFGNVPVGTTKTEHLTVSNIGTGNLTFSLNETHTIFDIPESGQEFTLTPGEEKVFDVNYTPTEVGGTSSRIVRVNSNAENGTQTVRIYGSGSEATSPSTATYTVNGVSFKMVRVSGGTFQMGATAEQGDDACSDEEPVHSVTLSDFSIGETEVTQALWQAVMGSNPSYFTGDLQRPVEQVSWDDCQTFISKLNELTGMSFRLPTEAEWEFAARGGNSSQGFKYAGSNTIGDVAWYDDNSSWETHAVGTKSPNELGLYDMSGNVFEWCQDWYGDYSSDAQTNPQGPSSGSYRVLRGGCWDIGAAGSSCRVSFRFGSTPSYRHDNYGLRLAL